MFVYLSSSYISFYLFINLYIDDVYMCQTKFGDMYLSIYLFSYITIYVSIYLSIYLPVYLFIDLSFNLSL